MSPDRSGGAIEMTPDADEFGAEWVAAWNSHDLDRIVAHYSDDIVFRTPMAERLVGTGLIEGKAALRTYWGRALEVAPHLKFDLQRVYAGFGVLTIAYTNHRDQLAAETCEFGSDGLVIRSAACYVDSAGGK